MHVWVSETRPRLQGANLTAWELARAACRTRCSSTRASALLMRRGDVDVVIVGADRVARNGDVCNKIGTYDKALAARDNGVPFYVALPSPTLDSALASGDAIPIEARDADEVLSVTGRDGYGDGDDASRRARPARARSTTPSTSRRRASSPGLVTERGDRHAARSRGDRGAVSGARWRVRPTTDATPERVELRVRAIVATARAMNAARHQPRQVGQRQRAPARRRTSTASSSRRPGIAVRRRRRRTTSSR